MRIIYSDRHRFHATEGADGRLNALFERPERVEAIRQALTDAHPGPILPPEDHGEEAILAVHDAAYIRFLRGAYARHAEAEGRPAPLFPDVFPTRHAARLSSGLPGAAGYYAADADSPILEGTWEAAYWSAQCALTAADLLRAGERAAYALCRPPGHHAYADLYGGFCYLNNAAIAARYLQRSEPLTTPVAILDIDFHHGNGTQSIFYADPTVLFCSLHAHPDEDYPYYSGMSDERGIGAGGGYNRNWPLPRGIRGADYLATLDQALGAIREFAPLFLIVSAGYDIAEGDPYGGFRLTLGDLRALGAKIADTELPTLVVQEGGYLPHRIGEQATAFLSSFFAL